MTIKSTTIEELLAEGHCVNVVYASINNVYTHKGRFLLDKYYSVYK